MAHSINWNSYDLSGYNLRVTWPEDMLDRLIDILQLQDLAYAGKGMAGPRTMTMPIIITGTTLANLNSNIETIRGLLNQEEDCLLTIDGISSRMWYARFVSLRGSYTSDRTWQGNLVFTCHDPKGYATSPSTQIETLAENESAGYGGTILSIFSDAANGFIYVAGETTNKVYKLSSTDLTKIAESPSYGGTINCICGDSSPTGYIYYGGIGGAGQYDIVKLDKATMAVEVRGPDYGGIIQCCCLKGSYVFYAGSGGAGENDIAKLAISDMTTILRSADFGAQVNAIVANSTHVFGGGSVGVERVRRYLIADMSYVDQSDDYVSAITGLALTTDGLYVLACGLADTVWRITIAAMGTEVVSADLGGDLNAICCDDDYIYTVGADNVVYTLDVAFTVGASHIAKDAGSYGNDLYAIAIDSDNHLYIGGFGTQTVWKLDSRHMPLITQSIEDLGVGASGGRAICERDGYIYTTNSDAKVVKLRVIDLTVVAQSPIYGQVIYALCVDDDGFVYCAGSISGDDVVWKLNADGLSFVAAGPAYGGVIWCLCCADGEDYIYYGGDGGAGQYDMCKLLKSDMATIVRGTDYGGVIYCCCTNTGTQVYYGGDGGAGQYDMCKAAKADMTTITRGNDYGGIILGCAIDDAGTCIYYGGIGGLVTKTDVATMGTDLDSAALGGSVFSVAADATHCYASTQTTQAVYKMLIADMTLVGKTPDYGALVYCCNIDDSYIYVQNTIDQCIDKLDKRVLWTRSDHEITVTTSGTDKANPEITLVFSGNHYSGISIENQTTSQTFTWEGGALDTEQMIIDSELWYVELEGASAMSGQDGDFVQLAAGANTIYIEDFVGTFQIDWTDAFA